MREKTGRNFRVMVGEKFPETHFAVEASVGRRRFGDAVGRDENRRADRDFDLLRVVDDLPQNSERGTSRFEQAGLTFREKILGDS